MNDMTQGNRDVVRGKVKMTPSEALVETMVAQGVTDIFGIVGSAYMDALDIRPRDPWALVKNLSGGNQQKVVLARWLITEPQLFILDEPTRGIDVGAKAQIQKLVADLATDGMGVVFISAELDEVTRISDRIAVLRDGHCIAQVGTDCTVRELTALIAGGSDQ